MSTHNICFYGEIGKIITFGWQKTSELGTHQKENCLGTQGSNEYRSGYAISDDPGSLIKVFTKQEAVQIL